MLRGKQGGEAMRGQGMNHRSLPGGQWSVHAGLLLLIAAAGCEAESPQEAPAETPVQLALDTVTIIHGDLFHRVEGVRRLPDGGLAVMNTGSLNVLLLDSLGDVVATIGRMGRGPGDFQGMLDMDTSGDSIVVLDGLMRRVQLFRRDSFVTMWSLREITGTPEQVGFSSWGAPVVAFGTPPDIGRDNTMRVLRETVELYRVDDPTTALETPVELPGDEFFHGRAEGGATFMGMPAFNAWSTYDLTRTGVVAADARDGRVVSFAWGEQAARTLRPPSPPNPVTEADLDRLWERAEATARRRPDMDYMAFVRQAVEVWGGSVPLPFHETLISDGSEILIKHFAPGSAAIVDWSLLDENGKTLGIFNLDRATELLSLRDREVLGVGRDSLDVEHVIALRIRGSD